MTEDAQVLVVGAGPAGAALSYLLATRGARVTLVERQLDFEREFRGEVLMPSGLEALDEMGLGSALTQVRKRVPGSFEAFLGGRAFFRIGIEAADFRGHLPAAVSQPDLLEMFVREAERQPHFRFVPGAAVRELLREGGRVVGVRARTREGERELRASFVVGADGRASAVRRAAGLGPARSPARMDVVWCKLPLPEGWSGSAPARIYLGRGHLLIAYVAPDELLQVAWVIRKGTYGELKGRGIGQWIEEMAGHVSDDLAAHLRRHREDFSRPFLLDAVLDRVDRWCVPGALVLGDAAHTMSPVGAQGLNLALRDAIVAANHLAPVLERGGAPEALDAAGVRIERERLSEVVGVQRLQRLPPYVVLGTSWWAELVRRALPTILGSAAGRAIAARGAEPFVFGSGAVRLTV